MHGSPAIPDGSLPSVKKKINLVIQIIRNVVRIVSLSYMNEFAIGIQLLLQLVVLECGLRMVLLINFEYKVVGESVCNSISNC